LLIASGTAPASSPARSCRCSECCVAGWAGAFRVSSPPACSWRSATSFHRLLWDDAQFLPNEKIKLVPDNKIRRVVMCTGKVYFDLYEEREKRGIDDIYLLRIEQLYPFPTKALVAELSRFKLAEMVWCQEEPRNMGAWFFVDVFLQWVLNQIGAKHKQMRYAGRPASASTAVGQMSKHLAQLKQFLDEALG
jgi:2-oxoglutarate dehydrogenase E1 component